jgi:ABC-type transporter MlaC component
MLRKSGLIGFLAAMLAMAAPSHAAKVSNARQLCIVGAIAAGSAALNNTAQLNALYDKYFNGEKIAQLAAGNYWRQYDDAKKEAQRSRVQQVVVKTLAPNLSQYKGSDVKFLSESGSKVKGVVTARHGEKRRVTWHFDEQGCRFIDVSIDGLGSLIGLVGKEPLD